MIRQAEAIRRAAIALLATAWVACGSGEQNTGTSADLAPDLSGVDAGSADQTTAPADAAAPPRCEPNAELLARVDPKRMPADLEHLVGLGERRSHAAQAEAAAYLNDQLENLPGVRLEGHTYSYQGQSYINLVATITGSEQPDHFIMAGAHYDSNSDHPTVAPGADDNASGTAAVLEVARVLAGCAPRRSVRLLFFSNEEKGTIGSTAYVEQLKAVLPKERMLGFLNVDMVGFGPADEDLDLATKPAYRSLAEEVSAAVVAHTSLRTKLIVSDHCG